RDENLLILREGAGLKGMRPPAVGTEALGGQAPRLLLQKPAPPPRVPVETGMNQLGGQSIFLSVADIQMRRGETVADTARVLSRYLDGLVIRAYEHPAVEEWACNATIPVINGLTDLHHPCQVLSDLFTIREKKRRWKGIKIAYVGDGNNVANSLIEGTAIMGMAISVACPSGYEPDASIVEWAREKAERTKASIEILREDRKSVV